MVVTNVELIVAMVMDIGPIFKAFNLIIFIEGVDY